MIQKSVANGSVPGRSEGEEGRNRLTMDGNEVEVRSLGDESWLETLNLPPNIEQDCIHLGLRAA